MFNNPNQKNCEKCYPNYPDKKFKFERSRSIDFGEWKIVD
jgi:hypothetical protein